MALQKDGKDLIGAHVVDNQHVYFHEDGKQAKGESVQRNNHYYFYDQNLGHRITEQFVKVADFPHDEYRYFGKYGVAVTGWQDINGNRYYFYPTLRIESPFLGTKEIGMTSIKFTLIASHTTLDMMVNLAKPLCPISGEFLVAIRAWISEHFTSAMTDNTLQAGKERRKEYYYFEYGRQARGIGFNNNDSQTNVMGQFIRFPEGIRYFEPYTGELSKSYDL